MNFEFTKQYGPIQAFFVYHFDRIIDLPYVHDKYCVITCINRSFREKPNEQTQDRALSWNVFQ